jgi:anti-sigma factor RsiW
MPEQRLTSAERADLVAYIDGELTEEQSRSIAAKLTRSVSARREVEALEKTWELLEFLPRPKAPEDFTTRTLTQVQALGVKGEQIAEVAGKTARRLVRALVCAAVALVTLGIGYVGTRWVWPDPTARLVRDLSVAEHLDEYKDVGASFEFLQGLDEMPSFEDVN